MAKMGSIPIEVETADISVVEFLFLMACLLPLTDLFFFSFLSFNCLTCFSIILLNFFYNVFKIVFGFLSSVFVFYLLNFVL